MPSKVVRLEKQITASAHMMEEALQDLDRELQAIRNQ